MPSYAVMRGRSAHTAHVQAGRPFEVPAKSTLLAAALDAGLAWPYGCRVGVCGRCRLKLLHGRVSQLGDHAAAIGESAVADGYILACRSLLESNILVLPPAEVHAADEELAGRVSAVTRPTSEIAVVEIELEAPYHAAYRGGQYARLRVPDSVPPRCFSYASACRGDRRLEFHIRLFPGGRLAGWLDAADRCGAPVRVSPPLGDMTLSRAAAARDLLFVAGGTGISPILAMLEELAAAADGPPSVSVIYAARDQAHLYPAARMAALSAAWPAGEAFRFVPILSREPEGSDWRGLRGHIFDHLGDWLPRAPSRHAFLCGPPGLVDATELALRKAGWNPTAISADRFIPAFD